MNDLSSKIAERAENTALAKTGENGKVRLTKNMSLTDMIKAMEPEIKRALPSVLTPERFTRMALSAVNNTPELATCTPMSFIAALMNAAQLGLEPNTPLGQAYLIPYKNKKKGVTECQFQIGYKGMIDLAYRNERVQSIEAHTVYENDEFAYELGLNPKLVHRPVWEGRGEMVGFYAVFKLDNDGFRFEVMSREDIDSYAAMYSKTYDSDYSPWRTNYESMAKKTVLKQLLKYAPMKVDFKRAVSMDESTKLEIDVDMSEVRNEDVIDMESVA